jgi:NAD(P)H-hydrate epimerase
MQKVLSAAEMREVDRLTTEKYGIPSILLMENAAHAAARVISEKLGGTVAGKSFLILCGKGNNGGDGAALARILAVQGAFVDVVLCGKVADTKDDAKINFEICRKSSGTQIYETQTSHPDILGLSDTYANEGSIEFYECHSGEGWKKLLYRDFEQDWDVLVDALFGTGLTRPIDGWMADVVHDLNVLNYTQKNYSNRHCFLISLDIPSGLGADAAEQMAGNSAADLTVTFTAPKPANVLAPASGFNGELVVADIGSPHELIYNSPSNLFLAERSDAADWLEKSKFTGDSHKTTRGRAIFVAGSRNMAGAAVLAANAAMRSGVGLVRVATSESAQNAVSSHAYPEVMVAGLPETKDGAISEKAFEKIEELAEKMHVLCVGSGLSSKQETTKKLVRKIVVNRKTPVVIDADGLNSLAPFDVQGSDEFPLILTPHVGEMQKLLGRDKSELKDRVGLARRFAAEHHVFLVLKGERSLIAAPDGRVVVSPTGNSGLGRAGNGDTLAGIVTAFVAQAVSMKIDLFASIVAAVYTAGLAGDIAERKFGKRVMTASDVRDCMSEAFREIEGNRTVRK